MILIKKIEHRGQLRILLKTDFDPLIIEKIKKLPSVKYSASYHAWHIAYDKHIFNDFKKLDIPFLIEQNIGTIDNPKSNDDNADNKNTVTHENLDNTSSNAVINSINTIENVRIEWNNRNFYIFISYSEIESTFIKTLDGAYWNSKYKNWVVRANENNLNALQYRYRKWDSIQINKMIETIKELEDPYIVQLFRTPQYPDKINLIIKGFKADIEFIKRIPDREYIKDSKKWLIPLDKQLIERLLIHFKNDGAEIIDRTGIFDSKPKQVKRSLKSKIEDLIDKYPLKPELIKYTDTLISQRYSYNTIRNYTQGFGRFLQYLKVINIEESKAEDVNKYLAHVAKTNVSDSFINNEVNAIKFYFEKVVFLPDFQIERIKRPRKNQKLPVILSISEVDKMMRSIENTKHLAILYTLYGGGMRLGEVLNLKIDDVYWERDQIHVKGGKGKKDRYVMLSQELKNLLIIYFDQYKPKYWLFEGQVKDAPYSPKSVQSIVKQAASQAGITKKVTPHTLRHCFATHLMDGGVGIRYIQELLGHKDIKTTLIYTHITTDNATKITSPLDNLKKS